MVVWRVNCSSSVVIQVSESILRLDIASYNLAIPTTGASNELADNFLFFLCSSNLFSEFFSIDFSSYALMRSIGIENPCFLNNAVRNLVNGIDPLTSDES